MKAPSKKMVVFRMLLIGACLLTIASNVVLLSSHSHLSDQLDSLSPSTAEEVNVPAVVATILSSEEMNLALTYNETWGKNDARPDVDDKNGDGSSDQNRSLSTAVPPPEHSWLLNNATPRFDSQDRIPKVVNKVFLQKSGTFPDF